MAGERLYKRGRIWWTWTYGINGKRKPQSTKCRDRRAAEAVARRLEREAASPAAASHPTATLKQACDRFQVDRENRGRAADTLEYYETKLGHLLRVFGDDRPIDSIDAIAVDEYIGARTEDASRHTIAKELGALRGVLRLARRRGEFHGDPAAVLPEGWSRGYEPRRRHHTMAQAKRLLLALPDRAAHLAFVYVTGARWGEASRAERADVDLRAASVRLRGTKTKRSARVVPIFEHVADLARRAHAGAARRGPAFARWGNARRDIAAACVRAKVPVVSPNDMRRSAATWLVERGVPSNLVALFLGHTTSRMVEIVYGHLEGAQLARAFAAVGIKAMR